jgi:hypothetical protein
MATTNVPKTCIRKYDQFLNIYLMFTSIFLFHLLFIFQGFDATDFGYHMTHQVFSYTFTPVLKYVVPTIFLTDFVGGMWLSIIGHPNVLWAKLGGVLLLALNAAIIFSILSNYFEKRKVFFVVFISSLFISVTPFIYIHYFSFPAFLVNIELWLFNKAIISDTWSKRNEVYSFLLGLMVVPIILSRFTLLPILIIPLLFAVYYYAKRKEISHLKEMVSPTIKGIIFSAICFGLIYWYLGIFNGYIWSLIGTIFSSATGDVSKVDSSHTMGSLFRTYQKLYTRTVIVTVIFAFGISILSALKKKTANILFDISIILITFSSMFGMMFMQKYDFSVDFFAKLMQMSFIGIICLLSIIHFLFDRTKNEKVDLLLISSIFIMLITPIGSNEGPLKSVYGMWLPLPLSLLCLYKIKTDSKNMRLSSILSLMTILLISLLCISLFFHITYTYRDDSNRLNLNTEFSDPALKGIYSTSSRVEVVDQLISQIKKNSEKNDELLIVNDIPVFYYLTETRPSFGEPWPFLKSLEEIKQMQNNLENNKELPKVFVYSKVDTQSSEWPNLHDNDDENTNEKLCYLKNEYVNKLNYSLIWENKAFVIYGRPSIKNNGKPF